jgi:hypothetical protein
MPAFPAHYPCLGWRSATWNRAPRWQRVQWESTAVIERKQTACINTQGVKCTCMQEPCILLVRSHDNYFSPHRKRARARRMGIEPRRQERIRPWNVCRSESAYSVTSKEHWPIYPPIPCTRLHRSSTAPSIRSCGDLEPPGGGARRQFPRNHFFSISTNALGSST